MPNGTLITPTPDGRSTVVLPDWEGAPGGVAEGLRVAAVAAHTGRCPSCDGTAPVASRRRGRARKGSVDVIPGVVHQLSCPAVAQPVMDYRHAWRELGGARPEAWLDARVAEALA